MDKTTSSESIGLIQQNDNRRDLMRTRGNHHALGKSKLYVVYDLRIFLRQISMETKENHTAGDIIYLSGEDLTPEDLCRIGYDPKVRVDLTEEAWKRVAEGRAVIDRVLARNEIACECNSLLLRFRVF